MQRLKTLLAIIAFLPMTTLQASTATPQVAFLNHLYAVVDNETIEAIEQSETVKDFTAYKKTTVVADGGETWTGRYFTGRSTYIELFAAGDFENAQPGAVGLAISPDRTGGIETITRALSDAGISATRGMRKRNVSGEEVDWFHTLSLDGENAPFWAMEYVPSYLDHPNVDKEPAEGEQDKISRERYNRDTYQQKLVRDVSYVAFVMDPESISQVQPLLSAAGYQVKEGEGVVRFLGQEAEIALFHAVDGKQGIRELRFQLNRPVETARNEYLGNSKLSIGPGKTANWTFKLP